MRIEVQPGGINTNKVQKCLPTDGFKDLRFVFWYRKPVQDNIIVTNI